MIHTLAIIFNRLGEGSSGPECRRLNYVAIFPATEASARKPFSRLAIDAYANPIIFLFE